MEGLKEKRDVVRDIPHKTPEEMEQYIVQCGKMLPCYDPKRLRLFFGVTASEGAMKRLPADEGARASEVSIHNQGCKEWIYGFGLWKRVFLRSMLNFLRNSILPILMA